MYDGFMLPCACVAQVSNDVRMLLPLLIGILVAKWVADATTHSLYHGLLEVLVCLLKTLELNPELPVLHAELPEVTVRLSLSLLCLLACLATGGTTDARSTNSVLQ